MRAARYSYSLVTGGLFLTSLLAHFCLGWWAFLEEQAQHGAPAELAGWLVAWGRDTMENWQSEFLQLVWQVAGLSWLIHAGSPQSRDASDRVEAKIDQLLARSTPRAGGAGGAR